MEIKNRVKRLFHEMGQKLSVSKDHLAHFFETAEKITTPYNEIAARRLSFYGKKKLYYTIALAVLFLIIYGMLWFCFPPDLIFKNTTTNGGDTGAHNYIAKFFINELLPHFRMTGWDTGWFAGMPMLTFYFPLPYFLIAILSKIMFYNVAFKLVTILGSLILPASIYFFGKLFRFEYPYPQLASVGALAFLYMESFKIYGGNFLGTFAGEFSYSISFGLIFIFLGSLYRGMEKSKFDWLFAINCLLVAGIILTHLITAIAILIIVPSFLMVKTSWKIFRYIALVLLVGFFLTAFWSVPFVLLIKWTPTMIWTNIRDLKELFPLEIMPALTLGVVGVFFSTLKRDKRVIPITWTIIVFLSLFFTWSGGRLYNARFLPFIFIFAYLLAAYGMMNLYWLMVSLYPLRLKYRLNNIPPGLWAKNRKKPYAVPLDSITIVDSSKVKARPPGKFRFKFFGRLRQNINKIDFQVFKIRFYRFILAAFVPVLAFLISAAILAGNPLGPAWARYNYTGYEDKADWKVYDQLMKYLDTLPNGRVMFEFDKEQLGKFGTPRAFELIPYWTDQAGMEGLLVESSLTAPFHYINQSELSKTPRGTVAGWKVPSRNYEAAMKHLLYMNIVYIMVNSPEVQGDLENDDSRVTFIKKIDPYFFYIVRGTHNYVEVMDNYPFRFKPENWVFDMRDWYLNTDNLDNPVILDNGSPEMNKFTEIKKKDLAHVPNNPIQEQGQVIWEKVEREKIEFRTTAIGVPHLVKVSYFPNWKVKGAEGPYLVSPSFMMVIPTQNDVILYYGMTTANKIGVGLTILGIFIVAAALVFSLWYYRSKKRKMPGKAG